MDHSELCICGHYTQRHKDIDLWDGWGLGKCELCDCSRFECEECVNESNS